MSQSSHRSEPMVIQGGMGVAVSAWQLARAVSLTGQLGVVSGTALDIVLLRRLQAGDVGGHMRRALDQFPFPEMVERILTRYFRPQGMSARDRFEADQVIPPEPTQEQLERLVVANFVEVFLAKEGHDGYVGINFLEKIQTPTLASLFGAMLAGVDYVLMGAGIPRAIPGVLDRMVNGEAVELPLHVAGAVSEQEFVSRFDPLGFCGGELPWLERPKFLAIVASASLANVLARKASGRVDGFVVEGPTAGGHNAPPRGPQHLNDRGEPVYGPRDAVDLDVMRGLGIPFWLAGSYGSPDGLHAALQTGAAGIQVGTAFAFCDESGLPRETKEQIVQMCRAGTVDVVTDPLASPTGFPFKVLQLPGSLAEQSVYEQRQRLCDLGFLRQGYRKPDGTLGWRCPGEPIAAYLRKGGSIEDTCGRKCVCNGLVAAIGLGQRRAQGTEEPALFTCGDDVRSITRFLPTPQATQYSAADVVDYLLTHVNLVTHVNVRC